MKGLQEKSDKSIKDVKKTFTTLLKAGKTDIDTYNKMLPKLKALEASPTYDRAPFSTTGLDYYINGLDGITIDQAGAVVGYQAAATEDLNAATDFIREHADHDSTMTSVIANIKTRMRTNNQKDIQDDDPYLKEVADTYSINLATVQTYNQFRRAIAEYAAMLKPYHEQVQQDTPPGSSFLHTPSPEKAKFGTPDPAFDPKPDAFKVPDLG
jgi:hypothetical protein